MSHPETQAVQQAAARLLEANQAGKTCPPIRDLFDQQCLESAYAVQNQNTNYWLQNGRRLVGRKIGLTSKSVQQQLGVNQPDYGMLFADMHRPNGLEIDCADVQQAKIEAEVALVLEKDLTCEQHTVADLISATAYALPALEIVGCRVENWDISIMDTIADNASSGLFVLGHEPRKLNQFDLRMCGMVMERGADQVSVGAGLACLGSPLNAAVWLADVMVQNNRPLQAGDILLSGALGPMVNVNPGDVFKASIAGLGNVSAVFSMDNNN